MSEDGERSVRRPSRMQEMMRKKLVAAGRAPPDPQPPPCVASQHPIVQELLEAGGQIMYEKFSKCLIKHACGTKVTKLHGRKSRRSEPEAMQFIREKTSIPVPRIHEVGEQYFTMDLIPNAETLEDAWETTLSDDDRSLVRRQMRDYITQLHAIKSPDGMICSLGGGPAIDSRLFLHEGGPFSTESAYSDFLVSDLGGDEHASIAGMIRRQMREDHDIVLTHGDLHAINILVRLGEGVVGIIDWELAGYYPEHVDFVKPYRPFISRCGYYRELHDIFPRVFEAEFAVDQLLSQWGRH